MDPKKRRLESQLCKAVNDGEPRSVQLFLTQGASPDLVGSKGVAAVHLAAGKETEKNTRCLKMLLEYGADPNTRSPDGLTPLHIAALWGCSQNLKLLLINGGNPNIKDNEGNTPGQLAEQEENDKCARLLQEYQSSSVDTEDDDLPQFQYSVYSDQTDVSSYPESDYSFSSHSSMISEFGEAPLSSTRRSSFFNLSNFNGRPNCIGISHNRLSDVDNKSHPSPSLLSSTRMSTVGTAAAMPTLREEDLLTEYDVFKSEADEHAPKTDGRISPSRRDTLPAFPSRRASRKSVSFRDVDEYFPVFSPESPKQHPCVDGNQCTSNVPLDMSEYSDFLDTETHGHCSTHAGHRRHVAGSRFVFNRESSESPEEEMEKTIICHCASALEESDDEQKGECAEEIQVNIPVQPAHSNVGSSSSGTGSSNYSSCDSDHYTSALDASLHPRCLRLHDKEGVSPRGESARNISTDIDSKCTRHGCYLPLVQTEPPMDSKSETKEHVPGVLEKLALSEFTYPNNDVFEASSGPVVATSCESVDQPVKETQLDDAAQASLENVNLPLTPSPFVTGRTRSRLIRTRRQTPRSHSSEDFYRSPHAPLNTPSYSGKCTGGDPWLSDCREPQSSTLRADSSSSQADTFILPRSVADSASESQTLSDTVMLEENRDSSMDAYERNLAEVVLAMRAHGLAEDRDFLTDDLTSTDEATTKRNVNNAPGEDRVDSVKDEDVSVTKDYSSQSESVSSSSSSTYFSPRRSSEDSDLPRTPGTGCTPRYSMSRLSSCRRPQNLANLSYTPGGRPLIQDLEEPVDTSSSEETILYDWRREKENQKPQMELQEKHDDRVLPDTKGLTDKELRLRLVEMGESPGPISCQPGRHTCAGCAT
ncbi:hypothetical protein F7725_027782 [Dissostichus mawsoni]|uniref:LEM domain-containing protein n=1 Tax=Dissostichus mawsoni TaxID=36200 RepID=A0A7J5XE12_DISMA|nr:hypothetical protein F7725_027782 [Dissostichus mawsoni]